MRRSFKGTTLVLASTLLLACAGEEPPPAPPPTVAPPPPPVASAAPAPTTPPPPPEPTPEEKKKAEALAHLNEDRAKWQKDNDAELARWTPDLHAAAKAIADKSYPTLRAAIDASAKGPQRKPGDADRDKY